MILLLRPIRNISASSTIVLLSHWWLLWPIGDFPAIVSQWESRRSPIGHNFKKHVNFWSIPSYFQSFDKKTFKKQDPFILFLLITKTPLRVSGYFWFIWFFDLYGWNFFPLNALILWFLQGNFPLLNVLILWFLKEVNPLAILF